VGNMGNVVANRIVRMLARKAVGSKERHKASGHPKGRRKKRHGNASKGKKAVD
jgi:hypothetical protein